MMSSSDFICRIRSVNWRLYKQGVSRGSIADSVIGMMSENALQRQNCRSRLENQVLPQSVLTEAALYVIPFLVEMIANAWAQEVVYELLVPITICSQPDAYDEGIELGGAARSLTQACRERIAGGILLYLRDVQDRNLPRGSRMGALSVVCRLPECRAIWLPAIKEVHDNEGDPEMRERFEEWILDAV